MPQKQQSFRQYSWWIAFVPMIVAFIVDLWSKESVLKNMIEGQRIEVLEGFLSWHFIRNPGAAFSIGTDFTWLFTVIQSVGLLVVLYLVFFRARSLPWLIVLGFLGGGIAGNLFDRLFREPGFGVGHVIDFVSVKNFAIFNLADSFIVCSIVFMVLLILLGKSIDGTEPGEQNTSADVGDNENGKYAKP